MSGKPPKSHRETTAAESSEGDAAREGGPCLVVGIGASAGGLQALTSLLKAMDGTPGVALVIIQHLDPNHPSLMSSLLDKHSSMEVIEVSEPCPVSEGRVYLIPPGKYLRIEDHQLILEESVEDRGRRMPVDYFFRSLAEQCGERCACLVLTGTGSDGTQGLTEVKEAGGLTIAQDPESAEYDGMPRSVVASGMVDLTLPLEEIPGALVSFRYHPYLEENRLGDPRETSPNQFNAILNHLHARIGYDFRSYKKGTMNRRIQRRMGLRQMKEASEYLDFLRDDPDEVHVLFRDLLIGVTRFFRDPEVWESLAETVIPPLVRKKSPGDPIRVWIPGCSTGEEAYTIAILIFEEVKRQKKAINLQLFATDLDQGAIEVARGGLYPVNVGLDLTQERMDRFFTRENGQFRVNKRLRECCIFAAQNLISDPPFSNLDLVSCRNLLIYLERSIQAKITELFHFALSPEGVLILGSSESTAGARDLFDPISKRHRIFRKREKEAGATAKIPVMPRVQPLPKIVGAASPAGIGNTQWGIVEVARKFLLDHYAPPAILTDAENVIHYYHGAVGPYLRSPSGQPSQDLFANLRGALEVKVRGLIRAARQKKKTTRGRQTLATREKGGAEKELRITVEPFEQKEESGFLLITFEEIPEDQRSSAEGGSALGTPDLSEEETSSLQQLEYELQATREDLKSTIEELESSNEELKASNEEVMSMNEELRSANEELETSREELQSLNEELSTVNTQLNEKVDELESANDDLTNLIGSTRMATIFLDPDLRIRRFTDSCEKLFNIIPSDEGRPISDLSSRVNDGTLVQDAREVMDRLQVSEKEVRLEDGWYLRRILPFRTSDNQIKGVVMTLTDIDALKKSYESLKIRERQQARVAALGQFALGKHQAQELFQLAVASLAEAMGVEMAKVLKLKPDGHSFELIAGVGWDEKLAEDCEIPAGSNSQAGYTLQQKGPVVVHDRRGEERFQFSKFLREHGVESGISMVLGPPAHPWGVLGGHSRQVRDYTTDDVNFFTALTHVITEVMERERALAQLEESRSRLEIAKNAANLGTHDYDVEMDQLTWDRRSREFWGVDEDEDVTYETFIGAVHQDDRKDLQRKVDQLFAPAGSEHFYHEFRIINLKDGEIRWIAASALAFFEGGKVRRVVGTHQDITEKRLLIEEQALWAERLEEKVIERTSLAEQRADDLRQLASQITDAEERARRNVAQVIHDDVQQLIIAAKMRLSTGPEEAIAPTELQASSRLLDEALDRARNLVSELNPPVLHDGEFDKALTWLADHVGETLRLKVDLKMEGELRHLEHSLATLLFHAVRELLFNAVKHSGIDEARVKAREAGEFLEIVVEDSGKGFDVPQETASKEGFGLFNVEERINAFGGTMTINSEPGNGSQFLIKVPLRRRKAREIEVADLSGARASFSDDNAPPSEKRSRRTPEDPLRILIVDDHEMVREGFAEIISIHNDLKIVGMAGDGLEAIHMTLEHQPDLVIMDISMPEMNGIEATQQIKRQAGDTVVIGLSLHEEKILGETMRQAGASAYLQKDVAGTKLVQTIREIFPVGEDGLRVQG